MRIARAGRLMLLGLLPVIGCSSPPSLEALAHHRFRSASGGSLAWEELRGEKATVLVTLDPECPFSQACTTVLDMLQRRTRAAGIAFVGFYPGPFFHATDAAMFAARSGLGFPQLMDSACVLANALEARVTPEVFVIDAGGKLVYRGAIDDSAVRAGRKKPEAVQHYLADVLDRLVAGDGATREEVTAVGCIVECP